MPEDPNVTVLLENDDVRVAKAIRPPGTKVPMHTHPAYVAYFFAPWKGRFTNPEGKVVEKSFPAEKVLYSPGKTHAVEVIGTKDQEVLVIEWKKNDKIIYLDIIIKWQGEFCPCHFYFKSKHIC
jgi:hypothetical protein